MILLHWYIYMSMHTHASTHRTCFQLPFYDAFLKAWLIGCHRAMKTADGSITENASVYTFIFTLYKKLQLQKNSI